VQLFDLIVLLFHICGYRMDGILEDGIDLVHRAYMMSEKKKVIKIIQLVHIILLCLN
jgi:hypothetical protein